MMAETGCHTAHCKLLLPQRLCWKSTTPSSARVTRRAAAIRAGPEVGGGRLLRLLQANKPFSLLCVICLALMCCAGRS